LSDSDDDRILFCHDQRGLIRLSQHHVFSPHFSSYYNPSLVTSHLAVECEADHRHELKDKHKRVCNPQGRDLASARRISPVSPAGCGNATVLQNAIWVRGTFWETGPGLPIGSTTSGW